MYGNYQRPYSNGINQQSMYEQIDNQINQLQQMREQIKNNTIQPAINQTFQLAPNNQNTIKYASSIADVNKESVINDTPFFSNDMSVVWIKNNKGEVKTYELNEIVPKDEKDLKIEYLQAQIEDLKKGMKKYESYSNVDEPITNAIESEEPTTVSTISKSSKKSK